MIGVIAEFNPFHFGHEYFLKKVSELFPDEPVCVVQSGNFTQRGDIAVADKYKRASCALQAGADMVLELPLPYSISSAEYFARGAFKVLSGIEGLDKAVFGAETDDIEALKELASVKETRESKAELKRLLKEGMSYPRAYALSLGLSEKQTEIYSRPNNILAVEYIKQINANNPNITPFCIKREGDFSDTDLQSEGFASASALRKELKQNGLNAVENHIPSYSFSSLDKVVSDENLFPFVGYALSLGKDPKEIEGFCEGVENRFSKQYFSSESYEDFMEKLKTKRFTRTRLQRLVLYLLLDITKNDFNTLVDAPVPAILLAVKDKSLLKKINIPLIKGNRDISSACGCLKKTLELTQRADVLYAAATGNAPSSIKNGIF